MAALTMALATPCAAANLPATPATAAAVFASAQPGDVVTLTGSFASFSLADRDFGTAGLRVSAWGATFSGTVTFTNVTGLSWRGGLSTVVPVTTSQRAFNIQRSTRVTLDMVSIGGNGNGLGYGIIAQNSSAITVKGASIRKLRLGIGYLDVAGGTISGNLLTAMTSDGINITGSSSQITASANRCQLPAPSTGAHPDCIQMWSDTGKPQLADITLTGNIVSGATQGITLFDRGGQRIVITGNTIDTSYPQGIACYLCDASRITGNTLTTQAGARWQTVINATGVGLVVSDNSIGPRP
ncbi:hypothetical protein IP88_15700 [alpha proteobacterium AAP81b]|nr:hypothetical protein IP88_15700 [alpha proteobacterium AAP81b]